MQKDGSVLEGKVISRDSKGLSVQLDAPLVGTYWRLGYGTWRGEGWADGAGGGGCGGAGGGD